MLTEAQVARRITLWGCCSHSYLSAAVNSEIYGDTHCAEKNWRLGIYMFWAQGILCETETEAVPDGCYTIEYASEVAERADCYCRDCGCPGTCTVTPNYTVIDSVAVSQRAAIESLPPATGDQWYVVTGTTDGIWSIDNVVRWNGSGWDLIPTYSGQIVQTDAGILWTTDGSTPGLLYPSVTALLLGPDEGYQVISDYPQIAAISTRTAIIQVYVEVSENVFSWVTVLTVAESALASYYPFSLNGIAATEIQAIYVDGVCQNTSANGEIIPPIGGCGTVDVDAEAQSLCGDNEFSVVVDISNADGWPIGDIVATVDGEDETFPAVLGENTVGPFPSQYPVNVVVTNSNNEECNFDAGELIDPSLPEVDTIVAAAVDASFEGSALPDTSYLIVSDDSDSANNWASHVGELVTNTTYTIPADGDIIFAEASTGPAAYWQRTAGYTVRVFPPIIIEYNNIFEAWRYYVEAPLAPAVVGTPVVATYDCGTPSALFSGDVDDLLVQQTFFPACGLGVISGEITYTFGDCEYTVPAIVREYEPDGEVDPEFSSGGLNSYVADLRIQADGKILVGGNFTLYGATQANRFTRLNADGTLDTTYNTALGTGFNNVVVNVEYDEQGRALVGGLYTTFNGNAAGHIIRLNADGSVDNTFVTGAGFNGSYVQDMAIDPLDGTILVGGLFTTYQGVTRNRIVALNPDGSVNTAWAFGTGFNNYVQEIVIGDDGSAYMAGVFTTYNGTNLGPGPHVIRILSDGTLDTTFVAYNQQSNNDIQDLAYLPDGRILMVGEFTAFNGSPAPNILMFNNDGTPDTGFMANIDTGFGQAFQDIRLLPNGQIMLGGVPPGNIGTAADKLIRLNSDGTRDVTYDIGTGPNSDIYDIALAADGSLVVGGAFTVFDGFGRLRVARIN